MTQVTSPTESSNAIQDEIVDELSFFDSWEDRYSYLIDLGRKLPNLADQYKTDDYRVRGCQSQVWIYPTLEDSVINLSAESDTPTVKGLVSLLLRLYSGRSVNEILSIEPEFIEKSGLAEHLSGIRVNGMRAAVKQIKKYAKAYSDASESQG